MKKLLQSFILLLAMMLPAAANAYQQLAEGVYRDGSTLFIGSGVTSLGNLQVNPGVIYCYGTIPPACAANTFTAYGAALHVPAASLGSYFVAQYWNNFGNIVGGAVEPASLTLNMTQAALVVGESLSLNATVLPANAFPKTPTWTSTNPAVATVNGGNVAAVGIGECDIVAACLDKEAVCHVTVAESQVQITLDKHEAKVLPNHIITLTPTMSPHETTLKVTSSNPAVAAARLVGGVVQVVGLAEGTATVVVVSEDGLAVPDACLVTVYTELGDVNADGFVNISDVTSLINYLLSNDASSYNVPKADANRDNKVNISDVTALINYLLKDYWPWEHACVDLGLPSGTLWATCNVGADRPEEYGDYFAWGETAPKDYYAWSTYKWCNGSYNTLTKYCNLSSYGYNGFTDGKTELEPEDDAAYVNWGPSWRMPTKVQQDELRRNCTWTWTQCNGVNGILFTGPNGNTIFLPAAGGYAVDGYSHVGTYGYYFSIKLEYEYPYIAYDIIFDSDDWYNWSDNSTSGARSCGHPVRAVRVS
ncbi:MAG: Ig-like domain-containing protein [Muribaculaceae bacterium]|nr:Ig-like domain-containing protein [Muribaculaceae bacterium]